MPQKTDFAKLAAQGVRGLEPYVPGKPTSELKRERSGPEVIKLASNENPLGPPVECINAIHAALGGIAEYPDGSAWSLKQALVAQLGIDNASITIGNGSNELLSLTAETFLQAGDEAIYSQYGFVVYGLAVQATGAAARVAPALTADDPQPFGHDLVAMRALISKRTRLIYIANPNNPTGTWLEPTRLRTFIADLPDHVLLVLDEAYREYMPACELPDAQTWLKEFPNLILCRTFSKMYALAGLRLGYALSHPRVADLLNRVRQPFNVNSLAQVAGIEALRARHHVSRSQEINREGMAQLRTGLSTLGWTIAPSAGNFVLANTGGSAAPWYTALLHAGIIVRPVLNYGLPDHLRITVGLPAQNERLIATIAELREQIASR